MNRKSKNIIRTILTVVLCCTMLWCVPIETFAADDDKEVKHISLGIQTEDVSDEINAFVLSNLDTMLETIAYDPEYFHASDRSLDALYVMEPFYLYTDTGDEIIKNESTICYPVISNNEIVCIINVFYVNDELHYTVSNGLVKELNAGCLDDTLRRVILTYPSDGSAPVVSFEALDIRDDSDNVFLDVSGRYSEADRYNILQDASDSIEDGQAENISDRSYSPEYLRTFITKFYFWRDRFFRFACLCP